MTDQYAVMGNPIAQSKSPFIHAAFARQFDLDIEYRARLVEPGDFKRSVDAFFQAGGRGLNITAPFKREAFDLSRVLSARARLAGSVNTLSIDEHGRMHGENTDGAGIVRDIVNNLGVTVESKRLLILGAGGAVRGVLGPILDQRPALVVVANRTESKAAQLVQEIGNPDLLRSCGFDELDGSAFDILINGTAAGLGGELPQIPESLFATKPVCYDMMYAPTTTPFNQWAQRCGVDQVYDGMGMLVEQAAESFCIWHGVRPETRPVIAALRAKSGGA